MLPAAALTVCGDTAAKSCGLLLTASLNPGPPNASFLRSVRRFLATAVCLLVTASAFAAKTDVVVLKNGDHITGEVKLLSRGQLKLSTDDAGTIYIEWDKIVSVTTSLQYEVVTTGNARYVGTLAPSSSTELKVVAKDGTATVLAFLEVVSFAPIKEGLLERIDGTLDVGGSYTKASGVGQTTVDLDAHYRRPAYDMFTHLLSNLTRANGEEAITQFTWRSGYLHSREDGWIVSPFVFFARDVDLGLSFGAIAALTGGRYVQRSNRSETLVAVGAAVGREHLIDGRTLNDVDAVANFLTSFYRHDYPKTDVDFSLLLFPELNRWGRVRANTEVKLKRELFKDFIAAITAYDTYDSQPQVPDASRNDIAVSFSIGWTF
jgi:hypothetical protein